MTRVSQVIHQYGRPVNAKTLEGTWVERPEKIYIQSYQAIFPCLDYDSHFVYEDPTTTRKYGSTLLCTCGSPAVVVGYDGYMKFASYQGEKVVACLHYTQNECHADGSH
jgi:hypothetical protein